MGRPACMPHSRSGRHALQRAAFPRKYFTEEIKHGSGDVIDIATWAASGLHTQPAASGLLAMLSAHFRASASGHIIITLASFAAHRLRLRDAIDAQRHGRSKRAPLRRRQGMLMTEAVMAGAAYRRRATAPRVAGLV